MIEDHPVVNRPIGLTETDWQEIYQALNSKVTAIREGQYDDEDEPGFPAEWADWLDRIMDAIGPDGKEAAARGVEPCDMFELARRASAESGGPRPPN